MSFVMFAPSSFVGNYLANNLVSFWSWREIAVLFTTTAVGARVWLSGRALRPRLTLVPIFALYEALLNVMLFLIALRPVPNHSYWLAWSYGGIAENCLLILLAIEITCVMLPAKVIAGAWSIGLSLLAILSIGRSVPARTDAAVLNVTLAGDFIAALVLLSLMYFRDLKWPTGYRQIIAGVILPAAIHAASAIHWQHYGLTALIQAVLPLASLAGLVLFMVGQGKANKARKKDYEEALRRLAAATANQETQAATCSA
jgi:hypothetical protein